MSDAGLPPGPEAHRRKGVPFLRPHARRQDDRGPLLGRRRYYLYRDKLAFAVDPSGSSVGAKALPAGKVKEDPFFGKVETYRSHFVVHALRSAPRQPERWWPPISEGRRLTGGLMPALRQTVRWPCRSIRQGMQWCRNWKVQLSRLSRRSPASHACHPLVDPQAAVGVAVLAGAWSAASIDAGPVGDSAAASATPAPALPDPGRQGNSAPTSGAAEVVVVNF